ncbi:MAG: hypothetical protein AAF865_13285 [Pseudomonadota bacterium]
MPEDTGAMPDASCRLTQAALLERVRVELATIHTALIRFQGTVSDLLPEAELQLDQTIELQALDHTTQSVQNLEALLALLAAREGTAVMRTDVERVVTLAALRARLLGEDDISGGSYQSAHTKPASPSSSSASSDITWL